MPPLLASKIPIVGKKLAENKRIYKEEEFTSRHIAELKDAFSQIQSLIEQKEKEIEEMMENQMESGSSSSSNDSPGEEYDHEAGLKQTIED